MALTLIAKLMSSISLEENQDINSDSCKGSHKDIHHAYLAKHTEHKETLLYLYFEYLLAVFP